MQLKLYLAETASLAAKHTALLNDAAKRLENAEQLHPLEQNGVLHCLQILTENAIGKAKHLLKAAGHSVPVSAYDAMQSYALTANWPEQQIQQWNAIIGMRNRIVHEYMNIDISLILELVKRKKYLLISDFLQADTP